MPIAATSEVSNRLRQDLSVKQDPRATIEAKFMKALTPDISRD
jgi:hypothetical protein